MFLLVFGNSVSRVFWWFLFPIWNEKIIVVVLCQDMPAGWIGRIAWNEQYKCVYGNILIMMPNAQSSKWYRKSCFERNHSKMKAFVNCENLQQDKENISSVSAESWMKMVFIWIKPHKKADFCGLFAFKMNDSHSNQVNRAFYGSNGTMRPIKISVVLHFKRRQCQETQKREKKIILRSTFNFVDPGDFDKNQNGIV